MLNESQKLMETENVVVKVTEEHHIVQALRTAREMACSLGMSQAAVYCIATAVSELANNLIFHAAEGGKITVSVVRENGRVGVEIVAEDNGPGIVDVKAALQDGFTTRGGLGGGLPGVKRLMDDFEIVSEIGRGTKVWARKWQRCR